MDSVLDFDVKNSSTMQVNCKSYDGIYLPITREYIFGHESHTSDSFFYSLLSILVIHPMIYDTFYKEYTLQIIMKTKPPVSDVPKHLEIKE